MMLLKTLHDSAYSKSQMSTKPVYTEVLMQFCTTEND